MPTTLHTRAPVNPFFVPVPVPEDTVDALPEPSASRPWPVTISGEDQHDHLPSTSQSWPPASDLLTRKSFGAVGEELDVAYTPEETYQALSDSVDFAGSPAAAFLASFAASPPSSELSSEVIPGYSLGPTIGHGGFSTIRQATTPSGGVVAVKIVRHSAFNHLSPREQSRQRSRLSHETRVWVSLSHENILPLFDSHTTSEATYLITLYCPTGSLLDILNREGTPALEQTDAGCMFRQVVKGLQYLHDSAGVVHGDIKLENVLVDESGVCRLTDFGLSRRIGGDPSGEEEEDETPLIARRDYNKRSATTGLSVHLSLIRHNHQRHRNSTPLPIAPPAQPDHMFQPGSLPYAAPELLLPHACSTDALHGHGSRPTAHPAQDMWALGVLLYTLLTGTLPFNDPFEPRLQMKILRGTYEIPRAIGPLADSVLKGCLERDVGERWTIDMVDDASWGIGYGVDVDPVIREEQRSQSLSRTRTPAPRDDLSAFMSSCSLRTSVPIHSPPPLRGRSRRIGVRSQSRSPSPSVAPRTPDDDDDEAVSYFGTRHRRRMDSGDVQIVLEDEDNEWDSRDRVYDGELAGADVDAVDLPLEDGKLDRVDAPRGRPGVGSGGGFHEQRKTSRSRTRSCSLDSLGG
ncbi:kinase-like domain-containing protein [Gautieria morchelliformis]|nr:kinase-like domain-containing protein [Gautieria morchelliformis]